MIEHSKHLIARLIEVVARPINNRRNSLNCGAISVNVTGNNIALSLRPLFLSLSLSFSLPLLAKSVSSSSSSSTAPMSGKWKYPLYYSSAQDPKSRLDCTLHCLELNKYYICTTYSFLYNIRVLSRVFLCRTI